MSWHEAEGSLTVHHKITRALPFDDIWIEKGPECHENFITISTPAVISADNLVNNIVGATSMMLLIYSTMPIQPVTHLGNTAGTMPGPYYGLAKVLMPRQVICITNSLEWSMTACLTQHKLAPNRSLVIFHGTFDSTDPSTGQVNHLWICRGYNTIYHATASKITSPPGTRVDNHIMCCENAA
ncbi:MAG: hypothetical protein R2727_06725 [Bacteroidales bacterium]